MNSDPFDSAAWRTFNMLDRDESAIFDEAMLEDPVLSDAYLEMDRLSAAIAATVTVPVEPKPGQLDHLQVRLRLIPSHLPHFWWAVLGWGTAAVFALLLTLLLTGRIAPWVGANARFAAPANAGPPDPAANPLADEPGPASAAPATTRDSDVKPATRVETKRLIQEIAVLRDNLEKFQNRDRALFEVVPGMALPIVMKMSAVGTAAVDSTSPARSDAHSPLTSLLGDALTSMTLPSPAAAVADDDGDGESAAADDASPEPPTAIPIYDVARDSGILVVRHLPPAAEGETYNLWVTTRNGSGPIYVGSLPDESVSGADSFDFSLGSTMVLPSGFLLTRDPHDDPTTPTDANTILQGPPPPPR